MRLRLFAVLGILTLGLSGAAHGIGNQARQIAQIYDIYLGGLWIAEMTVDAEIGQLTYRAEAALETKGIAKLLYKASFEAEAQGRVVRDQLTTMLFTADSRSKRRSQFLEMRYRDGRPDGLKAVPEFQPKPWEIDPRAQADTADPLSAAISALTPAPGAPICNRRVEIFDGRKRYAVEMGAPEEVDGLIRCPTVYQRVAGFKPKQLAKPDFPLTLWFEPTEEGGHRILRAVGDTPVGVVVIRQRKES